jgi:excisionase family DNA binding protein
MNTKLLPPTQYSELLGGTAPEKLLTIQQAAHLLGQKYWQLQRAVKRGVIPSYAPFNSRRLVYLSEVQRSITASRSSLAGREA